jgi:hypothetical protein
VTIWQAFRRVLNLEALAQGVMDATAVWMMKTWIRLEHLR